MNGLCRREGCQNPRARGRGRQLCEEHGRAADRILTGRVPPFELTWDGPGYADLMITCSLCDAAAILAHDPTPQQAASARKYPAQRWAVEHECRAEVAC